MSNSLLTSNFLITLIKVIKKNKIVVQNGWEGYRIKFCFPSPSAVVGRGEGRWEILAISQGFQTYPMKGLCQEENSKQTGVRAGTCGNPLAQTHYNSFFNPATM